MNYGRGRGRKGVAIVCDAPRPRMRARRQRRVPVVTHDNRIIRPQASTVRCRIAVEIIAKADRSANRADRSKLQWRQATARSRRRKRRSANKVEFDAACAARTCARRLGPLGIHPTAAEGVAAASTARHCTAFPSNSSCTVGHGLGLRCSMLCYANASVGEGRGHAALE